MQQGLFNSLNNKESVIKPLADRMRPISLREFVGQEHLVGKGKILRRLIEEDTITSVILWGPPGTGKTTLAHIIAQQTGCYFVNLSAVTAGVKDLKEVMQQASEQRKIYGKKTILFIDEVHRFNKAQQDFFLPFVEKGEIIFIGATTENPSFEVNAPLLSRSRVFVLYTLSDEHIREIVQRALSDKEKGLGNVGVQVEEQGVQLLVTMSNGDARVALSTLELAVSIAHNKKVTLDDIQQSFQKRHLLYDRAGEEHYNIISALHKSMRGGDVNASLYWLARMLEAGEDPLYIVRRLVRFASEDVGMADPQALVVCISIQQAVHFIGMPEANTALAQAVVYLATAPKSNALYRAYQTVARDVEETRNEPVPLHLRNASTNLMKDIGYGKGYLYPHDFDGKVVSQKYFPDKMIEKEYYQPSEDGFEKEIKMRIALWKKKRKQI